MSLAPTQRTKAVFGAASLSMLKAAATAGTRPGGTLAGRECAGFEQYAAAADAGRAVMALAKTISTENRKTAVAETRVISIPVLVAFCALPEMLILLRNSPRSPD